MAESAAPIRWSKHVCCSALLTLASLVQVIRETRLPTAVISAALGLVQSRANDYVAESIMNSRYTCAGEPIPTPSPPPTSVLWYSGILLTVYGALVVAGGALLYVNYRRRALAARRKNDALVEAPLLPPRETHPPRDKPLATGHGVLKYVVAVCGLSMGICQAIGLSGLLWGVLCTVNAKVVGGPDLQVSAGRGGAQATTRSAEWSIQNALGWTITRSTTRTGRATRYL